MKVIYRGYILGSYGRDMRMTHKAQHPGGIFECPAGEHTHKRDPSALASPQQELFGGPTGVYEGLADPPKRTYIAGMWTTPPSQRGQNKLRPAVCLTETWTNGVHQLVMGTVVSHSAMAYLRSGTTAEQLAQVRRTHGNELIVAAPDGHTEIDPLAMNAVEDYLRKQKVAYRLEPVVGGEGGNVGLFQATVVPNDTYIELETGNAQPLRCFVPDIDVFAGAIRAAIQYSTPPPNVLKG